MNEKDTESEAILVPAGIRATLGEFAAEISEPLARSIAIYLRLLLRWNEKISLTSIRSPSEILTRHFGESLFGAQAAQIRAGRLLDVGSGAGFPGLPIFLSSPGTYGELLEPSAKKAAFLSEACRELALTDRVQVIRARLEAYSVPPSGYDFVTSRAVRVTAEFLEKCRNALNPTGRLVLWLGGEEVNELKGNPEWSWDEPARIPGSERRYVVRGRPNGSSSVSRETSR